MQTFNLDLSKKGVIPLLNAKQRDVGTKILINITDNGKEYAIPADASFSVWFSGKSGEGNYTTINGASAFAISGNTVTVELIMQMLNNAGEHVMCLVMNGADGSQLGLWNIPYYVEAIPGADSEIAQQYYQAFVQAQKKAEEAAQVADDAKELAIQSADRATDAAGRAEEAAERAEAGAGASIIVGLDEGNTATHTALEIYNAIQNKQIVVYRHIDIPDVEFISLKQASPSLAVFSKTGYPTEHDIFDIEIDASGTVSYKTHFGYDLVLQSVEKVETDIAPVSYLPQTLTDEQKAQARENIGAATKGAGGGSIAPLVVTLSEDESTATHTSLEIHQAAQNNQNVWLEITPGLYFPLLHRDEYCAVFGTFWDGTSFKTYSVYDDASVEPDEEHFVNEDDISAFQTEEQVLALIQANLPPNGDEVSY